MLPLPYDNVQIDSVINIEFNLTCCDMKVMHIDLVPKTAQVVPSEVEKNNFQK